MKRILIKISGESFRSDNKIDIFDYDKINKLCSQIKTLVLQKKEISIVIGGGNIFRGEKMKENLLINREIADEMGMLATMLNGLVLNETLRKKEIPSICVSAARFSSPSIKYFSVKKINRLLNEGNVMIFVGGLGLPYFSTDTAAILWAKRIKAELILMGKKDVDGIYDLNPKTGKFDRGKMFDYIKPLDLIKKQLKVMD
jgi:uridylate kinase